VGTKFFAIAADLPDGLPPFIYAARRDWTVANADAVKAFREALAEGIRFADANPDAARADYGKYVKLPPDALAKVRWNKMSATVTPQQLALWDDMMRRQGMLKNPMEVAKLIAP
jgi:ABC-type nitrate/sulfonate/bicarbonate transport system substrate-binding protein